MPCNSACGYVIFDAASILRYILETSFPSSPIVLRVRSKIFCSVIEIVNREDSRLHRIRNAINHHRVLGCKIFRYRSLSFLHLSDVRRLHVIKIDTAITRTTRKMHSHLSRFVMCMFSSLYIILRNAIPTLLNTRRRVINALFRRYRSTKMLVLLNYTSMMNHTIFVWNSLCREKFQCESLYL